MADHRVDGTTSGVSAARPADTRPGFPFGRPRGPAARLVLLLFAATFVLWFLDLRVTFDPPYLTLALNFVFIGIASVLVAVMGIRAFMRAGSWPVLLLGAGALTFGVATVAGGWALTSAGANAAITMHNSIALCAALLHTCGAFSVVNGVAPHGRSDRRLSTVLQVYLGSLALSLVVIVCTLRGLLPPFFVAGAGGTPLRQMVVAGATFLFFAAGLVFFREYTRSRAIFLYWYALGLLLTALGMAGILTQTATGTAGTWMGRAAQLLAGAYLFVAALVTVREARARNLRPEDVLASSFWRNEANLRLLFASIMDAIIVTDQRFVITDWNQAAEQVYGWQAEEVIGKPVRTAVPTSFVADGDRARWEEAVRNRGAWRGEVRQRRRDGREMTVLATISALKDPAGSVVGAVAVSRDITDRKRAEEALRESEARLRAANEQLMQALDTVAQREAALTQTNAELEAILSAIPAGLIAYDAAGKTTRMNELARQWLGWSVETWERSVGERVVSNVQFLDHRGQPLQPEAFPAVRAIGGEVVSGEELRVHLPERPELDFWAMFGARPILGPDGAVLGAVATEVNTTGLHKANEELSRANARLEGQAQELREAAETLEQRVAERTAELAQANADLSRSREQLQALSHRLIEAVEDERRAIARELHDQANQLLTSLMLGLGLLDKRFSSSAEASGHIKYLQGIGNDLSKCMHDLAVSLRPASLDRVGLLPALRQLVDLLESQAGLHIELVTTGLHGRLGTHAETAIYRIVQESLTNVIRHAQAGNAGVIVQQHDGCVTTIIEDDGKGFDVDWAQGCGRLGLTGMRERAEMLGGVLTIESQPGKGTTVYAEIPVRANQE